MLLQALLRVSGVETPEWCELFGTAEAVPSRRPFTRCLLFVAQRFDGFHVGRLLRGQPPKKDSRGAGNEKRHHDAGSGNGHAQVSRKQLLRQDRDGQADQDADNRSASADEKRFEEKLRENFFRRGTHSLANADLSRALL